MIHVQYDIVNLWTSPTQRTGTAITQKRIVSKFLPTPGSIERLTVFRFPRGTRFHLFPLTLSCQVCKAS
jgi:hypothetical protein